MKYCVIGLGRFGYEVATTLAQNGMEVMAIDSNETIIASIKDQVTQAICMEITDEASLRNIGIDQMDTVVVAIGENFDQSIIITVLLKKALNINNIVARAVSDIHRDILKLIGAHHIILPEKDMGRRLADSLSSSFTNLIRLSKEFCVGQLEAPASFIGKKIVDLDLFSIYGVHCIGVKDTKDGITPISRDYIVKPKDTLVLSGRRNDLEDISKL